MFVFDLACSAGQTFARDAVLPFQATWIVALWTFREAKSDSLGNIMFKMSFQHTKLLGK